MEGKAIFRIAKIKSTRALRAVLTHNLRLSPTPNIDQARSHLNRYQNGRNTLEQCLSHYESRLSGVPIRKNAVLAHEAVITGSPEAMAALSPERRAAYFSDAARWLAELHGGGSNVVSIAIHNDETTPHAHIVLVPKVNGRLNSRKVIGGHRGRLSELQSLFAQEVAARYGLARGERRSRATHEHHDLVKTLERKIRQLKQEVQEAGQARDQVLAEVREAKALGLEELRQRLAHLEQAYQVNRPRRR